ncbi:TetR family transcriptional regulator [Gordonia sp. NPDC003424]
MATPTTSRTTDQGRRIGLRERNKIRTRSTIREAAMALFADQGYTHTTVEQIARAAEVSHTTFFRYFTSKEQVVLDDGLDDERTEIFAAIPPGLGRFDLLRRLVSDVIGLVVDDPWASSPERLRLIMNEPALRVAHQVEADAAISEMSGFIAEYLGLDPASPRLRVFMAAAGGVMFHLAAQAVDGDADEELLDTLLDAFDLLEQGLPL